MNRSRVVLSLVFGGLLASAVFAGTVTQKSFQSTAMNRAITYYLYKPASYAQDSAAGKQFSVIYLMHWWAYKADGWSAAQGIRINPQLDKGIDSVSGIICVAPQDPTPAGFEFPGTSWWVDGPVGQMGTFMKVDMVAETDNNYATFKNRGSRGLCGASMGGFGVLHHLRINSDIFSVGYAIVPATDLRNYKAGMPKGCSWGLCSVFSGNAWSENNPMEHVAEFGTKNITLETQSGNCSSNCPSTIIPDFFYDENGAFDAALTAAGVPHVYHNMPETGHDYPSPSNMVAILKYFEKNFAANAVAPESKQSVQAAKSSVKKAQPSVRILNKATQVNGNYVGIDGKTLKTMPAAGVVIKAK